MKIELENAVVYQGSNLDVLPTLPDNSVDSIVTDPPYELGFMGKSWDNSGIAYSVELWTECMRVLKPGGHLLAFGGSRTWHRLAVAIEDAGFEMRDSIAWLYGSGFPKSMDISKQIDKQATNSLNYGIMDFVIDIASKKGITKTQLSNLFLSKNGKATGWLYNKASHSQSLTQQQFEVLKEYLDLPFESLYEIEREVIGIKTAGMGSGKTFGMLQAEGNNSAAEKEIEITAPSTPEAKQWQGWGTALKPAFEPVVVARKPLEEKTVAANVLKYGTGGLNIDGSRIGTEEIKTSGGRKVAITGDEREGAALGMYGESEPLNTVHEGRWPANIILDPYTAELLDEQSGQLKGGTWNNTAGARHFNNNGEPTSYETKGKDDSVGGASRFFYVAKASKKDRNEGLDELPIASSAELVDRQEGSAGMNSPRAGAGRTSGSANIHPTVKPTTLMEYLIKLVTPPNGTVLDPFTGSGSTGKAALLNDFKFIGIELTEEYLPIIEGRLKWASEQVSKETSEVLF